MGRPWRWRDGKFVSPILTFPTSANKTRDHRDIYPGPAAEADALANRMKIELAEMGRIRILRPIKQMEMRIRDFDDSVTPEEIASGVAAVGGCSPTDIE